MLKRIGSLFIINFILSYCLVHAGIKAEAYSSSARVGIEDSFVYSIRVESSAQDTNYEIVPPSFDEFHLMGTSRQTSMSIVNNAVTRATIYNYTLRARETGPLKIEGAEVSYGDKSYKVNPVSITVYDGSLGQQPSRPQRNRVDPFDSLWDRRRQESRVSAEDAFVEMSVNKKEIYAYEQVILTVSFYKRPNIMGDARLVPLEVPNIWLEELDPNAHQDIGYAYRNNQRYVLHKLHYVIYPTRSGEIVVPPARINFTPSSFFSSSTVTLQSKQIILNVSPLPGDIMPVGSFSLKAMAEQQVEYLQHHPFTLRVEIEGSGRLRDDDIRVIDKEGLFEIYPPRRTSESRFINNQYITKTIYEYVLTPLRSGGLKLPVVSLEYFDPEKKEKKQLFSNDIKISVLPFKGPSVRLGRPADDIAGQDIMFLKQYSQKTVSPMGDLRGRLIVQAVLLAFMSGSFIINFYRVRYAGLPENRIRMAEKNAKRTLRRIKPGNDKETARQYLNVMNRYLNDRFEIRTASLTKSELVSVLRDRDVEHEIYESICSIVDALNGFIYDPDSQDGISLNFIRGEIGRVIDHTII